MPKPAPIHCPKPAPIALMIASSQGSPKALLITTLRKGPIRGTLLTNFLKGFVIVLNAVLTPLPPLDLANKSNFFEIACTILLPFKNLAPDMVTFLSTFLTNSFA